MANRKERHPLIRLISCLSAFLLIGAVFYVVMFGVNCYAGSALTASVLGLAVPAVIAGEGTLDAVLGFFEWLLDGVMEVLGGIGDFFSSFF